MVINREAGCMWLTENESPIFIYDTEWDEERMVWWVYYIHQGQECEGVLLDNPQTDNGFNSIVEMEDIEEDREVPTYW